MDKASFGQVVRFAGRRGRRYVVIEVEDFGRGARFALLALSGARAGSAPSGIAGAALELDEDQTVRFEGGEAGRLSRRFAMAKLRETSRTQARARATAILAELSSCEQTAEEAAEILERALGSLDFADRAGWIELTFPAAPILDLSVSDVRRLARELLPFTSV